jgi:DNA replication and repair protein RecF
VTATLAVSRLVLGRFRTHRALDLRLDFRPVAIFGPNGAGKTNLIEAVSLLSPGRGLRGAANEDLGLLGASWAIRADTAGVDGSHEIVSRGASGSRRSVEIDGKNALQATLGSVIRILWLTPAMDRLWTEPASDRRRFLDRMALSLFPGHAEPALAYDRALRERNRLIRDGLRDVAWFEALERAMARYGAELIANRVATLARLEAAPSAEGFPVASLTLEREGPGDAEGLGEALRAGRGRDMAAGRTLIGPHRDDLGAVYAEKGVAARLCSTGEQKAMLISLILANAWVVAQDLGAAPVLLLDEIAAHLDAPRRAALYAGVMSLGGQAWMTGTGAGLFEELGDDAQRLELREEAGESIVTRL